MDSGVIFFVSVCSIISIFMIVITAKHLLDIKHASSVGKLVTANKYLAEHYDSIMNEKSFGSLENSSHITEFKIPKSNMSISVEAKANVSTQLKYTTF